MRRCIKMDSLFSGVDGFDYDNLSKKQIKELVKFMYLTTSDFGDILPPSFEKIRDEIINEMAMKEVTV